VQVADWLIVTSGRDHLFFGIDGGWYVVISAVPDAIICTDMVADAERDTRLRDGSVWL
jgi:hypothetical protein